MNRFTRPKFELIFAQPGEPCLNQVATLPGAILAVLCCIGLSYLLGYYMRHIGNFSQTYGALAGFIAFMIWCYWNSFALLVGAKLNAELAKESAKGPSSGGAGSEEHSRSCCVNAC